MLINSLSELFQRDLRKLASEINLYENEADLWLIRGAISNSGGNLCLHLTGNLQHFIGAILGKSGYVRDRANEFAAKNVSRSVLLKEIEETIGVVSSTLAQITDDDLNKNFPIEMFGSVHTTGFVLMHLYGHLDYHLGQLNYHRRLIDGAA